MLQLQSTRASAGALRQTTPRIPSMAQTASVVTVWSHVSDVLHNNDAACEVAAVQNDGMEYVTTAFMAHLAYGHCGDAAMQLIAHALELCGDVLGNDHVKGMCGQCEGCHLAGL